MKNVELVMRYTKRLPSSNFLATTKLRFFFFFFFFLQRVLPLPTYNKYIIYQFSREPPLQISEMDDRFEDTNLVVEWVEKYCHGGFHPVHLHDVFNQRYEVIAKLAYGSFATVWLAKDHL